VIVRRVDRDVLDSFVSACGFAAAIESA